MDSFNSFTGFHDPVLSALIATRPTFNSFTGFHDGDCDQHDAEQETFQFLHRIPRTRLTADEGAATLQLLSIPSPDST